MNGPVEETGKVASGIVTALAGSPALLVMVILNCVMIGVAAWFLHERMESSTRTVQIILERCMTRGAAPT